MDGTSCFHPCRPAASSPILYLILILSCQHAILQSPMLLRHIGNNRPSNQRSATLQPTATDHASEQVLGFHSSWPQCHRFPPHSQPPALPLPCLPNLSLVLSHASRAFSIHNVPDRLYSTTRTLRLQEQTLTVLVTFCKPEKCIPFEWTTS